MTRTRWMLAATGILVVIAVAGAAAGWPPALAGAGAVRSALMPAARIAHSITAGAKRGAAFIVAIRDLHRENLSLREQLRAVQAEATRLREEREEAETLRREFGVAGSTRFQLLAAHVIGRDPNLRSANVILDRGRRDGLAEGFPVIAAGDILVGRAVRVDERSAIIRVLSDPASSVSAVSAEGRTTGVIRGQQGLDLRLELVEPGRELKIGEEILSSGQDGLFPRGLSIGRVSAVQSQAGGVLTTATIIPAERYDRLEVVFAVVTP